MQADVDPLVREPVELKELGELLAVLLLGERALRGTEGTLLQEEHLQVPEQVRPASEGVHARDVQIGSQGVETEHALTQAPELLVVDRVVQILSARFFRGQLDGVVDGVRRGALTPVAHMGPKTGAGAPAGQQRVDVVPY
ncbi:hypothetical protein [Streptomyces sp. NPDC046925]|uniref:hypothetical protein n=1 Tax=Streptomyces sp. NPDC046925 TaxID=3155375 RepID=UPI0033E250EB